MANAACQCICRSFCARRAHLTGQRNRTATEHVRVNHCASASSTFNAPARSQQIMRQRFHYSQSEKITDRGPSCSLASSVSDGGPDGQNEVRRIYNHPQAGAPLPWSDLYSGRSQRKESAIARSLWQYPGGHRRSRPVYTTACRIARSWADSLTSHDWAGMIVEASPAPMVPCPCRLLHRLQPAETR